MVSLVLPPRSTQPSLAEHPDARGLAPARGVRELVRETYKSEWLNTVLFKINTTFLFYKGTQ